MSRARRRWPLLGNGVRLLRCRPGDTLVASVPAGADIDWFRQQLEDTVGYRSDVRIVIVDFPANLTLIRETA